jgi:hypothetical protein
MVLVGAFRKLMNKGAFFFAALLLVIAALAAHAVARSFLEVYMHRKAARISEASKQHTPYVDDPLAAQAGYAYNVVTATGIVLTVLSVVCMAIASIRREPGWYLILLLLLVFAIGAPMLL